MVERVSKTPGANYSNVRTTDGFKELMDKEFGYLVTPLAFNIQLELSGNYQICGGYGTPEVNNMAPGSAIQLSTEFPAIMNDKFEKKPGPLLFKLEKKTAEESSFDMKLKYDDLSGIVQKTQDTLQFDKENSYLDLGIRKSILLVYYSELVKELLYFHQKDEKPNINYKEKFSKFIEFFQNEMIAIGDSSLDAELDVLLRAAIVAPGELPPPVPAPVKRKAEELLTEEETKKLKQEIDENACCVVCLENKKNVLLLPCKHVCSCDGCSKMLMDCPLCRAKISEKTTVFV